VIESWREGVRKPDREIFARTLERLGVSAQEALMVDDLGPNLKVAREMGMETFKASDEEALIAFLRTL
jgi:putative hydrolase of the HAD superfamily